MTEAINISNRIQDILDSVAYFTPELSIAICFLLVIIIDLFLKKSEKIVFSLSMLGILSSGIFLYLQLDSVQGTNILFNGMYALNKNIIIFKLLSLFAAALSLIFFSQDKKLTNHTKGINDFYTIFLGALLGVLILISSAHLLMVFIAIEMISLASYLMVSYAANSQSKAEAGMKYVLFGATASAIMLYGISFIYGFSGSLDLFDTSIPDGLNEVVPMMQTLVILLFMAGIGFKLSFVPFHFWTPDAYQEAPTSVSSFLATVPKIAVFALLFNINDVWHLNGEIYKIIISSVAMLSMIFGNVIALFQKDPKRMMAYSSIGHTGFILILFVIPEVQIFQALIFYLVVYVLMNIGAFLSFAHFENNYQAITLAQLKGLGKISPLVGVSLVVLMVSLIGLPPTGGLIAKFFVFTTLISNLSSSVYLLPLLIVAVLTTVISLFYYFSIPLNLFLKKTDHSVKSNYSNQLIQVLIVFIAILVLLLGLIPSFFKF